MFSCTAPRFSCTAPMFPCRFAWMAPIFALTAPMFPCRSAWIAPMRSKSRSTAEPGRERRDEALDLFDTLEERPDLVSILQFIIMKEYQTNYQLQSNK